MTTTVPRHGGQLREIAEHFGIPVADLHDFSANINPDGPPHAVLEALRSCIEDPASLTAYPDIEEIELRQSIATYAGVSPANVAVANGFVPLLQVALQSAKVRRCLIPVPCFSEYSRTLLQMGVSIAALPLDPSTNFKYEIESLLAGDHDAILLANPQNPSGVFASRDVLLQLVAQAAERHMTVLLDEAFIDYTPADSLVTEIERYPNLVVFRSVTKFFGVPGLRVAYAVANPGTIRAFHHGLAPWAISTLASRAVSAAIADIAFADHARLLNDRRKTILKHRLEVEGIRIYPSAANFVLLRLPGWVNANWFWQQMITRHGIVLRNCSNYESLPLGHLRAAVRPEEDNDCLVSAVNLLLRC